jgi:octaprenyl-diphosphate synthase
MTPAVVAEASPVLPVQCVELYGPIRGELAQVDAILRQELQSEHPAIDELIKHCFRLGGKRLRPALLLLAAKACGGARHEHFVLGAVVEMIHTATLVHDDVLDGAATRRHLTTVNARWSNQSSVLLGDFLFTHSFYLASTVGGATACQAIGRATNIVCEGELRQVANRGNLALSEAEYLSLIEAKTAELCACCCRLGAHYSQAEVEMVEALERYGRYLGIAFQIVDDLLDLTGDERVAGKSLGTDLAQRKLTLPVIRLLARASPASRQNLLAMLAEPDGRTHEAIVARLAASDALAYTHQRARQFAKRAAAQLRRLPSSPERSVLRRLARFVVERRA